jgi:hypothetical protein
MEVSGQLHCLATLIPGKEPPVRIGYETGRVLVPVWTLWNKGKPFVPAGDRTPTVQCIASVNQKKKWKGLGGMA